MQAQDSTREWFCALGQVFPLLLKPSEYQSPNSQLVQRIWEAACRQISTYLSQLFLSSCIFASQTLRCIHELFFCNDTVHSVLLFFSHMPSTTWCWIWFLTMECNIPHYISDHYLGCFYFLREYFRYFLCAMKSNCQKLCSLINQRCSRQSNIIQYSQYDIAHMCHKLGK